METPLQQFFLKLMRLYAVPPEAWQALSPCMQPLHCRKGFAVPFLPGDMIYVTKGLLEEVYDQHGKICITRFIKEDDPAFARLHHHQGMLIALEETHMLRLSREDLLRIRKDFPILGRHFDKLMDEWYDMLLTHHQLMIMDTKQGPQHFYTYYPSLRGRIMIKDLASYLNKNPNYLSGIQ